MGRVLKQVFIGSVFILIAASASYLIYRAYIRTQPTCADGIQNGEEEGIDCGTLACGFACQQEIAPIQIGAGQFFKTPVNDYDFIIEVVNPNSGHGSGGIVFDLIASMTDGSELILKRDSFYILPGQTKHIIIPSIEGEGEISSVEMVIKNAEWQKLDNPGAADFSLIREDFKRLNNQTGEYNGVIFNNSDFDFDKVDIAVMAFSEKGEIVGLNSTNMRTFLSKTERSFKVEWPFAFQDQPARFEVEIGTNVFDNSNFIKTYGDQEKFQKFY